jgi:CHAT domain-containing protein/tetratricopeptide (TPR) repeat protein
MMFRNLIRAFMVTASIAVIHPNTQALAAAPASVLEDLTERARDALQKGDYASAKILLLKAIEGLPQNSSADETRVELVLQLGQAQLSMGEYLDVQNILEENWNAIIRHPDPERQDRAHYFLMSAFLSTGDYANGIKHSGALVERYNNRYGADHPQTLDGTFNHGSALVNGGQNEKGLALLDQAFNTLERGKDRELYHTRLTMVATSFENNGQYTASERFYLRLLSSLEALPESRELGMTYFNLAVLNKSQRKFDAALPFHEKAMQVLTHQVGPDAPETIAAVSGLGNTYTVMGRPASGVQFLEQAYNRARKVHGDNDNQTWLYANNYANALRDLERFEDSRAIDQAAYDWRIKNLPPNDEATEISTLNLGLDWMGLKRFKEAEELFEAFHASRKTRLGENHPDTLDALRYVALAQSYDPKGKANVSIAKQDIATLDRLTANIQAGALEQQGKEREALLYHRRAFEASLVEAGAVDPTTLTMLRNYALSTHDIHGNDGKALKIYQDLSARTLTWARTEIAATAGKARAEDIRRVANPMIYDVIELAARDPQAHQLLFQVSLDWKGLGSTEQSLLAQLRNAPPNATIAELVKSLQTMREKARQPGEASQQLLADINLAEVKLGEQSVSFARSRPTGVTPRQIVSRMSKGDALIDFIIGDKPPSGGKAPEQNIFAFVTLADGRAIVKNLGSLSRVKDILAKPDFQADEKERKALHKVLLEPLLSMKNGGKLKHLYIVPDGELFLVPFEGLLSETNKTLIERFDVTLMRSAAGLMQQDAKPKQDASLLLVGAPDYGEGVGELNFPALPGALQEVNDIYILAAASKHAADVLTKSAASEAAVRGQSKGRSILHMATHGFFLPPAEGTVLEAPWRAGVALGNSNGASTPGIQADDGIVYAAELSNWSLEGTELVVFSACETASGERSYVEGLRGIPAALAVSGAKRSMLAYWTVPDVGAANFMTAYYRNLFEQRMTYEQAFRATKRAASEGKIAGAEAPEVWQAFVMMRN